MKSLHIELTNRCILACPACPRTEWANILKRPVAKKDLDFVLLDNFLNCPGGKEIDTLLLCGDYGDCIYYPKFLEFIKHFRSTKNYSIRTNGSRQTTAFWEELASMLTENDEVVFAIDGLEEDNQLYRKNSHWPSIMQGLDIIKNNSSAKVKWQTIVFSFNQHQLDEIQQFAESKGAEFVQLITHRYGNETLIPVESFVKKEYSYKPEYNTQQVEIIPKCAMVDTIPTIGSDGIFYPCDWLRNPNTFYKSEMWKQKSRWLEKLHIANTTYDKAILTIKDWANYVRENSLNGGPVDVLCKMKCRKGLIND
jgi:MoaA/NifB/PqqE/SkfB family radical SAM enzyme